jgi:hypothetical protein
MLGHILNSLKRFKGGPLRKLPEFHSTSVDVIPVPLTLARTSENFKDDGRNPRDDAK